MERRAERDAVRAAQASKIKIGIAKKNRSAIVFGDTGLDFRRLGSTYADPFRTAFRSARRSVPHGVPFSSVPFRITNSR